VPCKSWARAGSAFCLCHDPAYRERLLENASRGGRANREHRVIPPGTPTIQLRTAEDIRACISDTVDKLARGEIDRGIANGVVYGCQVALRAIDVAELERRIAALEEARRPKGKRP
jgi:hypothetical protein